MANNSAILSLLSSNNYTTIQTIYQPPVDHSGFVTSLMLTIDIKSVPVVEFPYIPDDTPPDVIEQILEDLDAGLIEERNFKVICLLLKKGSGNWIKKATIKLFNKHPFYEIDLMPYFTKANSIDVAEDLALGLQLQLGNTLASNDSIVIFGTVVEEKKIIVTKN